MFGRGNWAILGLAKESLEPFKASLEDRTLMLATSQMAASAVARQFVSDALGVNPYSAPRLDDEHPIGDECREELATYAITEQESRGEHILTPEILECEGYTYTAQRFQLHASMPWYGLWAVSTEWKNVTDLASIKEHRSYISLERPYKFLQTPDKKTVDQETLGATRAVRKQVPVLLDFNEGRVYIENTNKKLIYRIVVRLQELGAAIFPVAWTYHQSNWPSAILNKLYERTQYGDDFVKRADEVTRFQANEIEKLDDREVESIVTHYFSMTQLPSELWVGVSTPAQVRLQPTSPSFGAKAPASATTLLHMTNEASILSGAITFQDRIAVSNKDGGVRTFRKDLFSMTLDDRINLSEIGAAMLRGFNLPTLKKDIQREIRETKQVPSLEQFWGNWLHQLSNAVRTIEGSFREILDIDGAEPAGILPMQAAAPPETKELVTA